MKWEYTVIYLTSFELSDKTNSLISTLDKFGKWGWEMIAVDNGIVYFKRPLEVEVSFESGFIFGENVKSEVAIKEMTEIIEKAMGNLVRRGASG